MKKMILAFALAFVLGTPTLYADLVSDSGGFVAPQVIDFEEFTGGWNFTAGPIQIGTPVGEDITYSSTSSNSVIGDGSYNLADNGDWTPARVGFVGINTPTDTITFDFLTGPVKSVGGFVNYAQNAGSLGDDFMIAALDSNGIILESYNVSALAPISTPGGLDEGAFRGIVRDQADIYAFTISNDFGVLDNLTFARVPEPSSCFVFGLAGLAMIRRRR